MSTSTVVLPMLAGGGSATVITTGIGTAVVRVLKRVAADVVRDGTKDIRDEVAAVKVKLASETGGNSHGLRQAINEMQSDLTTVREDVAFLKGAAAGKQAAQ